MLQKKETTRTTKKKSGVKVQDLATKKDVKGGGWTRSSPGQTQKAARRSGL